jgi:aminoglycoside phosphotransferase (APT) family kinase protein
MSMSQYLWAVARGLQTQVYPDATSTVARDSLQNCIGILTVIANALEPQAITPLERPASAKAPGTQAGTDRLRGPAENAAAYGDTAEALAAAARSLDDGRDAGLLKDPRMLAQIQWEKDLLDGAMAAMEAIRMAQAEKRENPALMIDQSALQAFLCKRLASDRLRLTQFRQVLGGRSRQTALFSIADAPGQAKDLVAQRDIPGMAPGPAFASVEGQCEVLKRMHEAGLKVPKPVCFESDPAHLGSPFLIVERCRGSIVEPDYWAAVKSPAIALQLAEQMGRLHAQPVGTLSTLLPHSRKSGDPRGWLDELERLGRDWHALAHWPSATVSAALLWMRANIDCVEDRKSVVHNDMVFHNVLAEGDELTAVLDWEQASVGHPAEDLGYCFPVVSAAVDWSRFLETYYSAGGPRISQRQVDYFALRAVLRLMNLVLIGGRNAFEGGHSNDVLVANAGASFSQKLLHRYANVLHTVLARN